MEIVSGGATPRAFSTSAFISARHTDYFVLLQRPTSQTIQTELINLVQSGGVLKVVLNDIDVVGGGEEACKC